VIREQKIALLETSQKKWRHYSFGSHFSSFFLIHFFCSLPSPLSELLLRALGIGRWSIYIKYKWIKMGPKSRQQEKSRRSGGGRKWRE
jgi:hypothetical protein